MEGFKVKCAACGRPIYETTDKFTPYKPLHGGMIRLVEPYNSWNWECYDGAMGNETASRFQMLCTLCGGYIASNEGRLSIMDPIDEPENPIIY